MVAAPQFANVAALMGDPARANMLSALLDGRARTATELAMQSGVTAQTASAHLKRMLDGAIIALHRQGRHRYYRLAGPEVAHALEALMVVAGDGAAPKRATPRVPEALRRGRTCYDHLAGVLGLGISDALVGNGYLETAEQGFATTAAGERFFRGLQIDVDGLLRRRRALVRPCLDWSERRPHLAGALAAALADCCFDRGWLKRAPDSRAVEVTASGGASLPRILPGLTLPA